MTITAAADAVAVRKPPASRFKRALLAPWQGLVLTFIAGLNIGVVVLQVDVLGFIGLGVGLLLLPVSTWLCRQVANLARHLAWRWQGVQIQRPYRPKPQFQSGVMGFVERLRWILRDPATWRDLVWSTLDTVIGFTLGLFAAVTRREPSRHCATQSARAEGDAHGTYAADPGVYLSTP